MAGTVTLKWQCVKLRPCTFLRAGTRTCPCHGLEWTEEEAWPKGSLDSDSLAVRFGKQNHLKVMGYSSMVNTHTGLRAKTPDGAGMRKLQL